MTRVADLCLGARGRPSCVPSWRAVHVCQAASARITGRQAAITAGRLCCNVVWILFTATSWPSGVVPRRTGGHPKQAPLFEHGATRNCKHKHEQTHDPQLYLGPKARPLSACQEGLPQAGKAVWAPTGGLRSQKPEIERVAKAQRGKQRRAPPGAQTVCAPAAGSARAAEPPSNWICIGASAWGPAVVKARSAGHGRNDSAAPPAAPRPAVAAASAAARLRTPSAQLLVGFLPLAAQPPEQPLLLAVRRHRAVAGRNAAGGARLAAARAGEADLCGFQAVGLLLIRRGACRTGRGRCPRVA